MIRRLFVVALSLVLVPSGRAQEQAALPYRLEDVKYSERFVGSNGAKELLARQGFVVTAQQFPQMFAAYLDLEKDRPWLPSFVTEDSVWHTYHVLLEDGVRCLEEQQAQVLQRFSARLVEAARAKSWKRGDVYSDLAAFAAVGFVLQDAAAAASLGPDLQSAVAEVTQAIDAGDGPVPLLFFGLPLAPERFRVSSFYSKQTKLRGYFRARQWYAICDFRLASPTETERALHLTLLIDGDQELKKLHERLCAPYDVLLGPPDDAGVPPYVKLASALVRRMRTHAASGEPTGERRTLNARTECTGPGRAVSVRGSPGLVASARSRDRACGMGARLAVPVSQIAFLTRDGWGT
jgi:hypothetical protein